MQVDELVKRVDQLLMHGKQVLATRSSSDYGVDYVSASALNGFRAAGLSFVNRVYGQGHPHFDEFKRCTDGTYVGHAESGVAILEAIRSEIEGGWLVSVKGLIAAELFADFLEMADHLLDKGYKDPAAVMAGSVLEEHMRQLCRKFGVDTEEIKDGHSVPKKADRLNADLTKADVYSRLDQKMITAWLDIRNKAAHGNFGEYTAEQVRHFMSGLVEFMARVSL